MVVATSRWWWNAKIRRSLRLDPNTECHQHDDDGEEDGDERPELTKLCQINIIIMTHMILMTTLGSENSIVQCFVMVLKTDYQRNSHK